MAVSLTADEMSRAKKIAAMLSATTDGERLNALATLQKIADSKKVRIDELLLALGNGGAKAPPSPGFKPGSREWWAEQTQQGTNPFWQARPGKTDAREGGDYSYTDRSNPEADRRFAEEVKREHERRQKARRAQEEAARKVQEDILRAKQQGTSNALRARLDAMQSIPESRLSAWEQDFRYSILDKALSPFWTPSEKQSAIINKILEKAL